MYYDYITGGFGGGCFVSLATTRGMWDLSLQPEIEPAPPALEARSLNHWTARGVPITGVFLLL